MLEEHKAECVSRMERRLETLQLTMHAAESLLQPGWSVVTIRLFYLWNPAVVRTDCMAAICHEG